MVSKKLTKLKGIIYIFNQLIGSLIGTWIISLIRPNAIAVTILNDDVSITQGFFLELLTTSVLTIAYFMLIVEKKGRYLSPFYLGMALFVLSLCAGPHTGASLNPARTFGPSIVWNKFGRAHWIYYFGPIFGSLLAVFLWYLLKLLNYEEAMEYYENFEEKRDIEKVGEEATTV